MGWRRGWGRYLNVGLEGRWGRRPAGGDEADDLVDGAISFEGVVGRGRNHETDDAVVVGCDEEGEVTGVEVCQGGGRDDQGGLAAELVHGAGLLFAAQRDGDTRQGCGQFGDRLRAGMACGSGGHAGGGFGRRRWKLGRCIREERIDVDGAGEVWVKLGSLADALDAPWRKEQEDRSRRAELGLGWQQGRGICERDGAGEVWKLRADEGVLAALGGDEDGLVGREVGGQAAVDVRHEHAGHAGLLVVQLDGGEVQRMLEENVDGDG